MSQPVDWIPGDALGIPMPAHPTALVASGAEFLTRAFRADATLASDQAVVAVLLAEECQGGSTGRKMRLRVRYSDPESGLPENLFVKFSRDFSDPIRDRAKIQMESEVAMARLSRKATFPVPVPTCLFADYDRASGTGLLIAEEIPFGRDGIDAHREKCLDADLLEEPSEYYSALIKANARLAAAHRAGCFSRAALAQLAHAESGLEVSKRAPYTAEQLARRIQRLTEFAASHPTFLPGDLREPAFLRRFAEEAPRFCGQEGRIAEFLDGSERYKALSHWNANIDNAWFWRDAGGELQCGLLDWGNTQVMNMGVALAGSLMAAEPEFLVAELENLVALYAAEFRSGCGEALQTDELKSQLLLHNAAAGLVWLIDAPALIVRAFPGLTTHSSPLAPEFRENEFVRVQLHMLVNFLTIWRHFDVGNVLDEFLKKGSLGGSALSA